VLHGVGSIAYVLVAKYRCDLGPLKEASRLQLTLPGTGSDGVLTVPIERASGDIALCKGGTSDPGNFIAVTPVESTLTAVLPK